MPRNDKTGNKIVTHKTDKYGWREAVEDTKRELLRNEVRREELEAAIKIFAAKEKAGEPWPGQASV